MKIRIKGNSVRFRLSKSEVDRLAQEGMLHETTSFGQKIFSSTVQSIQEPLMTATLSNSGLTLFVPAQQLTDWASSASQVGINENMDIGNNESLALLLEKDFKCIDASPGEDQSDFFENPDKVC